MIKIKSFLAILLGTLALQAVAIDSMNTVQQSQMEAAQAVSPWANNTMEDVLSSFNEPSSTILEKEINVAYGFACGLKPIPPLGCSYNDAICICEGNNCRWVFSC